MSFLSKLDEVRMFHAMVKWLRLREMAAWWLKRHPRIRALPRSGARYSCRYLESILLADEIFNRNVYLKAISPDKLRTFADVGSNVGYLPVLLREVTGRTDIQGILVDANPEMVTESDWHIAENKLDRVRAFHGVVGAPPQVQSVDFFLLPSNLGSSQFAVHKPGKAPVGAWKKIVVPRLNLEQTWIQNVGDVRCDFCKVDIEGSELQFVENERQFLARVDVLILEWHKWLVSKQDLDAALEQCGFVQVEVLEEIAQTGIAWYARK